MIKIKKKISEQRKPAQIIFRKRQKCRVEKRKEITAEMKEKNNAKSQTEEV